MEYRLFYGSASYDGKSIFVKKTICCSGAINPCYTVFPKETTVPREVLKEAKKLSRNSDIAYLSSIRLDSGTKAVFSGPNDFGIVDSRLFQNSKCMEKEKTKTLNRYNSRIITLECLKGALCPYIFNPNMGTLTKPKTDDFNQWYVALFEVYEKIMSGQFDISSQEWKYCVEMINLVYEGLSENTLNENTQKCASLGLSLDKEYSMF